MRKLIFILSLFFLMSCSKGIWITEGRYRPKNPNFSLAKKEFVKSDWINSEFLYVSKKKTENYDGKILYSVTGFLNDGRMIGNTIVEQNFSEEINATNSWETASSIGYYRVSGNQIEMQFFVPTDGGLYETRKGIVKKDTIILEQKINKLVSSEMRYDTLVKSQYRLKY